MRLDVDGRPLLRLWLHVCEVAHLPADDLGTGETVWALPAWTETGQQAACVTLTARARVGLSWHQYLGLLHQGGSLHQVPASPPYTTSAHPLATVPVAAVSAVAGAGDV